MKIGFNGRFLSKQFTGIGKHSFQLLIELAKQHPEAEFIVAISEKLPNDVEKKLGEFGNLRLKKVSEAKILQRIHKGLAKSYWEAHQIKRLFRREKVDIVHIPYPSAFKRGKCPLIVTVHDIIPWALKEYKTGYLSQKYNNKALECFLSADMILTVSEFSKQEMVDLLKVPAAKIIVAPNAADSIYSKLLEDEEKAKILKKYHFHFEKPFLFYLGGFDERKNVKRLLNIFRDFITPHFDLNLVIGGKKLFDTKLYDSFDEQKKRSPKIKFVGAIQEKDLPAFYQSAFAFINLSKYEGFNLPILEALHSGAVCIASLIPPHLEIDGDSILFIDVEESDAEVAQKILRLCQDEAMYAQLKRKVELFEANSSWEKSAKIVFEAYQRAVKGEKVELQEKE